MSPRSAILQSKVMKTLISQQNFNNFNKNLNISVESWPICTKPSEQGSFFWASQYESKECYAMIKTDENLNISAESWLIWQILPKKWLRLAPNGQFWSFCRFFHLFPQNEAQIDSEWPISPDSQLFPIFYHQSISFLEKSQKFSFHGEGYISKFFEFFNFFKSFHTKVAQNDPQWPILPPKWLGWAQNGQFWLNFNKNLNISVEWLWPIGTKSSEQGSFFWASQNESKECYAMIKTDESPNISAESWLIYTKPSEQGLFFQAGQNESKECCAMIKTDGNLNISAESRLICTGNFFEFFNFFANHFTLKWLKMTHNGKFCQKSGLDWLKIANFGHFAGFSIFSPKIRLRLTLNG